MTRTHKFDKHKGGFHLKCYFINYNTLFSVNLKQIYFTLKLTYFYLKCKGRDNWTSLIHLHVLKLD